MYVERSQRLAHGRRTAAELAQYSQQEFVRHSVAIERPRFNRPAFEAAAVGILGGFVISALQLAGLL